MIICLKNISEKCFLRNLNVNADLKFLWELGALGEHSGTWALGGHSKGTRALKALKHLST